MDGIDKRWIIERVRSCKMALYGDQFGEDSECVRSDISEQEKEETVEELIQLASLYPDVSNDFEFDRYHLLMIKKVVYSQLKYQMKELSEEQMKIRLSEYRDEMGIETVDEFLVMITKLF